MLNAMERVGLMPAEIAAAEWWRGAPAALQVALLWHERAGQPLAFAEAWRSWRNAAQG